MTVINFSHIRFAIQIGLDILPRLPEMVDWRDVGTSKEMDMCSPFQIACIIPTQEADCGHISADGLHLRVDPGWAFDRWGFVPYLSIRSDALIVCLPRFVQRVELYGCPWLWRWPGYHRARHYWWRRRQHLRRAC